MKKMKPFLGILVFTLLFTNLNLNAQVIWQDDFESYVTDSIIEPQSPFWNGWGNAVTSALVSGDSAYNGVNSLKIWNGLPPGAAVALSDVLLDLGDSTSGRYAFSFKVLIPSTLGISGAGGYYNIQHTIDAGNNGTEYAFEVYLGPSGQSYISIFAQQFPIPERIDEWVTITHVFDLDRDRHDFFYDGIWITSQKFSVQSNTTVLGTNRLAGMDLYAACSNSCPELAYFDDFELKNFPDQQNDGGILAINSSNYCLGDSIPIQIDLKNWGFNAITTATINWSVNGALQTPISFVGAIQPDSIELIDLGKFKFPGVFPYNVKFWIANVNGVADTVAFNDTNKVEIGGPGVSGNFTINSLAAPSATNFVDFNSFFAFINQSNVCGDVIVDVVTGSGPYMEQVNISGIQGSANAKLYINGNREILDFPATISAERATFSIFNSSYIIMDSLTVTASGSSYGVALYLDDIDNVTIKNSTFLVDSSSTTTDFAAVRISGLQTSPSSGSNFSNFTFEGNTVVGGYYGFSFYGISASPSTNILIKNNKFRGFYYYGNYLYYSDGMTYEGNDISRPNRTIVTTTYGMYMFGHTNQVINKNRFHNLFDGAPTSTSTCYGFYNGSDATPSNSNVVMNNLFYEFNHRGTVYALYDGGSDNTNYYNNTISLDNTSNTGGSSYGIYHPTASTNTDFKNNIVSISRGGNGTIYGLYFSQAGGDLDYNNVFINSSGTGSKYYGYNGSAKSTLADWQSSGEGANDLDTGPMFVSIVGNDFQPTNISLNAAGFSAPQVTEDFNGAPRVVTANDIGSFNIQSPPLDVAAKSILVATPFCASTQPVSVIISNNGSVKVDSLVVNWTINGVLQTPIDYKTVIDTAGAINGNLDTVLLTNYTFATGVGADFIAWLSAPNGTTPDSYSPNDTAKTFVGAALVGNYTVNPSVAASATNFVNLASLSSSLSSFGVCGPVNVIVSSGTYTDNISLDYVEGSGPASPIVIDGVDSSLTIINYNGSGTGIGALSINQTNNVTVKNFSLKATPIANGAGAIIANSANIMVSNCYLQVDTTRTSSTLNGIVISSNISSASSGGSGSNIRFENNTIKGGYYGFYAYGSTGEAIRNIQLINNVFSQAYYYGLYAYYCDTVVMIGNDINLMERANINADGVYFYYSQNLTIKENKIFAPDYGLYNYIFTYYWPKTQKNEFVNNMIYSDTDFGLYLYYTDSVTMYHNTVVSNSGSIPAVQLFGTGSNSQDFDVRNNIFYSNGAEALKTNVSDLTMFTNLDYNNYYTTGSSVLNMSNIAYPTLASYVSAQPSFNANSIEGNPILVNVNSDLHILGALINGQGDNSVGVTKDIDGDLRPLAGSTIVDMGADEFDPPSCPPPTAVIFQNVGFTSADMVITGGATSTWSYEIGSVGFTPGTGNFGTAATSTSTIGGLTSGTAYELYIREICSPTDSSPQIGPYSFGTAYGIPYHENFESFALALTGPVFPNGWTSSGYSGWGWESERGTGTNANSSSTGPLWDRTNFGVTNGMYMYMETSSGTAGDTTYLSSPPIFVDPNKTTLLLEYSLFNYGTNVDRLDVLIDTNGVSNVVASFVGPQQASQSDNWIDTSVVLTGYQGKSIQIKFRGVNVACCTGDIAIDEIRLFDTVAVDLAIDSIVSPVSNCGLSATSNVTVSISNVGLTGMSNFPVSYVLNNGTPVTETVTSTILPGNNLNYTFTSTVNIQAVGSYSLKSYIAVPGDGDLLNDTVGSIVNSGFAQPINTMFPSYYNDFEGTSNNWITYGTNNSWEIGTPSTFYISGASSGTKAYVTSAAGNHNANELSYIETPCFDLSFFQSTDPFDMSFEVLFKTEQDSDQVWLEMTTNNGGTWTKVLPNTGSVNFYNNLTDNSWDNFSSAGAGNYIPVVRLFTGIGGLSQVKFRFAFKSNGTNQNDGFAIDNFRINTLIGVNENTFDQNSFGLHPNPAKNNVTVSFNNVASGNYEMTIEDVKGQKIVNDLISVSNGNTSKVIDVSQFESGVYFVKVVNGSSIITKKLVVN